jgi:fumarylacetoacetate (FAA) hydrolase
MKIATLKQGGRDGTLVVVSADLATAVAVPEIAPTLQAALDDWVRCEKPLERVYERLCAGDIAEAIAFDQSAAHSPLPRAYLWCEASVWISHMERCRKASGRDLPDIFYTDPAMHEGGSDVNIGPRDPMATIDDSWDLDLEAGICVITDDVEMGVSEAEAAKHIKLVLLVNDFSLRAIQIPEMSLKGMGAIQGKPANSFSPVAVSPKSLGDIWRGDMLAAAVHVSVNGERIGQPEGHRDALFTFPRLIAHLARTRNIAAGAIIGAGTVSNRDENVGVACLYEKRALEILKNGHAKTPWLKFGDRIKIEALDDRGRSIFGSIEQAVTRYTPGSFERGLKMRPIGTTG